MDEATATEVVELLRQRRIFASVNRRAGVYNVGVRVVIPDGREAIWDNDGAAGLEAMVLRDGVLVGFVPQIPDSDDLDAAAVADIIARADYDAPPTPIPPTPAPPTAHLPSPPSTSPPATPPEAPAAPKRSGWRERFRRGH
jgi:hypothetical protein